MIFKILCFLNTFSSSQMKRMNYDSKYINVVKDNKLDGSALVFGDVDDLKDLLDMSFGEWATFRLHFLSLPPYLRRAHNNKLPPPAYPKNQLSRFLQHAHHHYSSSPNLGHR